MRGAQHTSMIAYIAAAADSADDARALAMLRHLNQRLEQHGLTLAQIVDNALNPRRAMATMPKSRLSKATWRAWVSHLLAHRDELPEKDVRHLRFCQVQTAYLSSAQMRWIFDILARVEPAGCGTWGAPN